MDHAVSLVQAYLQLNGYFTSAEYPVMEANGSGDYRTLTDIDILAFRFPSSNGVNGNGGNRLRSEIDHGLGVPKQRIDMIIGEVKEGKVGINSGARNPAALRNVIERFGCPGEEIDRMVEGLLTDGYVVTPSGYQVRLIAFGAFPPGAEVPPCRIISLGHVLQFLQAYVKKNWEVLRRCQFKDPAFGFLMTLEKAQRGGAGRRGRQGVEVVKATQTPRPNDRRGRGKKPLPVADQRPLKPAP